MTGGFAVRLEPAKALGPVEECALLREAACRSPNSAAVRLRLARLYNLMDAFEDAIALLEAAGIDQLGFNESIELGRALLARDGDGDSPAALDLSQRAATLAQCDSDRSRALADAAKAAFRISDSARAVALLEEALELDPSNSAACKRLATHWLASGSPEAVLALTSRLATQGVSHSRLLSSQALALAQLGRLQEARSVLGLASFLHQQLLPVPPGWRDLTAFNASLADELSAHPAKRKGRHGTASRETVRIDSIALGPAPAARALLGCIAQCAQRHAANAHAKQHAWLDARPESALLASWCVITEAEGFEDWHSHPEGWMSGVYYAEVPGPVAAGRGEAGCLSLGLPPGLVGTEAAAGVGREIVRPQSGLVAFFPSHVYHRTFPHGSSGRRICISFDLRPG